MLSKNVHRCFIKGLFLNNLLLYQRKKPAEGRLGPRKRPQNYYQVSSNQGISEYINFELWPMMPGTFNRLRDAEAALSPNEQVWAIDVLRSRDSRSYVGKKFIVCGRRAMYNKMVLYQKPTVYEIITEQPTSLYLDIDLSLHPDELSLDFEETSLSTKFVTSSITKKISSSCILVLHLKCHYILFIVELFFDNNTCSCASYVMEFNAFISKDIQSGVTRSRDSSDDNNNNLLTVKHRLRDHLSFIDLSVYKKSQQFRTYGSTKFTKRDSFFDKLVGAVDLKNIITVQIQSQRILNLLKRIAIFTLDEAPATDTIIKPKPVLAAYNDTVSSIALEESKHIESLLKATKPCIAEKKETTTPDINSSVNRKPVPFIAKSNAADAQIRNKATEVRFFLQP
ncbi:hypothetical protein BD770DRAFT_450882 [Pilaira anomala]|nr:hypothetical protein BD770DRAFT_450882 [Pilaira anomala]